MTTSTQLNKPATSTAVKFQPSKVAASQRGGHVWRPPQVTNAELAGTGYRAMTNGPLKGQTAILPAAERHTRQSAESRRRKETDYGLGVDY